MTLFKSLKISLINTKWLLSRFKWKILWMKDLKAKKSCRRMKEERVSKFHIKARVLNQAIQIQS